MKNNLGSLMIVAILGPALLAVAAIVSVGAYDFISDPLPWPDGIKSSYDPLLPRLMWPIWFSLLVTWVVLGSLVGKLAGQRKGEVIGAIIGATLAIFTVLAYLAVTS
jgi:hypothetical protein